MGGDCIDLAEFILYGKTTHGHSATFKQAVNTLREMAGVKIGEGSIAASTGEREYLRSRKVKELMEAVCNFSHKCLMSNKVRRQMITSRGISDETIKAFRLGKLDREQADALLLQLDTAYGKEMVDDCGLTTGEGTERRLMLAGSIVIPIIYCGLVRNFVAYFGRGKYIKMRKSGIVEYTASPFGVDTVAERDKCPVFIVEGIFDALSAYEAGYACIATLGTMPSKESYLLMLDVIRNSNIRIVNDHDESGVGLEAALRHATKMLQANLKPYLIKLTPKLFETTQGTKAASVSPKSDMPTDVLTQKVTIEQFAELYGYSVRRMRTTLSSIGVESKELAVIEDAQETMNNLRKTKNLIPTRSILTDGLLAGYLGEMKPSASKFDLNDIWVLTNQNKEAIKQLCREAIPALQAVIEAEVTNENVSHEEYVEAVIKIINRYNINSEHIFSTLTSMGWSKANIDRVLKRDVSTSPIRKYALALTQMVELISTDDRDLMLYDEGRGIWQSRSHRFYNNILLKHVVPPNETVADVWKKVEQDVGAITYINESPFQRSQGRYIVLANGVYDTELCSFSPEFKKDCYATTALPLIYRPEAKAPKFKQFLEDLFIRPDEIGNEGAELDMLNKAAYVEELLGLLMVPDNSFQVFWTFLGGGGNGKSTLQNLIFAMLGPTNVSTVSLSQLSNKFSIINLVDKLANITSEKESAPNPEVTEVLKRIVGNEPVQVEAKYTPSYSAIINARIIISANQPIQWPVGDAMKRRQRNAMLTFPCVFTNEVEEPVENKRPINRHIIDELMKESSGILNLALAGLKRLRERGSLRELTAENEILQDITESSNPAFDFLFEHLKPCDMGYSVKYKDLYAVFCEWWHEQVEKGKIARDMRLLKEHGQFSASVTAYVEQHMPNSKATRDIGGRGSAKIVTNAMIKRGGE
jgi:putative DNA primase/helicase